MCTQEQIGPDAVDSLTTADIGKRGAIEPISHALDQSEDQQTNTPPAMAAAKKIARHVEAGETVIVLTGFPIPPTMTPETDGPPGAVSLARAIDAGVGGNVILATDPNAVEICKATARAGGLNVTDRETAIKSDRTVSVEPFPTDATAARNYADDLLSYDPAAILAVEKPGPNTKGRYHNMSGQDISASSAKVGPLYEKTDTCLTVGVGDGGNEIGMGAVEPAVRSEVKYGDHCNCDCGSGIACTIATDLLVPAAVSNWGAYGIVTCLSILLDTPLLHGPEIERRMLVEASLSGAIDGTEGGTTGWCDGLPLSVHESMIELLNELSQPPYQ